MADTPYWLKIRGVLRSAFQEYTRKEGDRVPTVTAKATGRSVEALLASEQGAVDVRIENRDGVEWLTITIMPWPKDGKGVRVHDGPINERLS